MLAFKIREYDHCRMRPIIINYHKIVPKKNNESNSIIDDPAF
jgi:hypothetical protein